MSTGGRNMGNSVQKTISSQAKDIKRQPIKKVEKSKPEKQPKFKIDVITKDNFDVAHIKTNIT